MFDVIQILVFILPSYLSNSIPVLLGGGRALDFGAKSSDGKRLLGSSKTVRGFIAGVAAGTLAGAIMVFLYPLPFFASPKEQFMASFMLAFGTMFGDSLGSFIKRRLEIAPGKPFLLDSVLFLVIALLLAYPFTLAGAYSIEMIAFLFGLTLILHPLTNIIANRLGMKKVPW